MVFTAQRAVVSSFYDTNFLFSQVCDGPDESFHIHCDIAVLEAFFMPSEYTTPQAPREGPRKGSCNPSASPNAITFLRSAEHRKHATKRFHLAEPNGQIMKYAMPNISRWHHESVEVANLAHMAQILETRRKDPSCCLIRDELNADINANQPVLRRGENRSDGTFHVVPRSWLILDVDNFGLDGLDVRLDPERAIQKFMKKLAIYEPGMEGVGHYWMMSSSCGVENGNKLKAHIVVWLDKPTDSKTLKRWANAINKAAGHEMLDQSLYDAVKPHFFADPIFRGYVLDPINQRTGFFKGGNASITPATASIRSARSATTSNKSAINNLEATGVGLGHAPGFEGWLARIGDGAERDGFYIPIRSAIASYIGTHGREGTDPQALKARIREVALVSPRSPGREHKLQQRISDPELDVLIRGALDKFGEKQQAAIPFVDLATDLPGRPPADLLPGAEASSILEDMTQAWIATAADNGHESPVSAFKVTSGAGKTRAVIKALTTLPKLKYKAVDIYVPTHKVAEEVAKDLRAAGQGVRVQVMKGRAFEDATAEPGTPERHPMCRKWELAKDLGKRGLPVGQSLCKYQPVGGMPQQCEHYSTCAYYLQFFQGPGIRIWPHTALSSVLPAGLKKPDLAIIDETFWSETVRSTDFSPDLLDQAAQSIEREEQDRLDGFDEVYDLPGNNIDSPPPRAPETHNSLRLCHTALTCDLPILTLLRELSINAPTLKALAKKMNKTKAAPCTPEMDMKKQRAAIADALESNDWQIAKMVSLLAEEMEERPDGKDARRVRLDVKRGVDADGREVKTEHIYLDWFSDFRKRRGLITDKRKRVTPILCIDADADERILQTIFGEDFAGVVSVDAERKAEVVQVADRTFSNMRLNNADDPTLRRKILDIAGLEAIGGRKVLVVTIKAAEELMRADGAIPKGVEIAHFGGLRGVDGYKDYDAVIIAGRNQPAVDAFEGAARALWWRREADIAHVENWDAKQTRGLFLKDGRCAAVETSVHPDPDVQHLIEQVREAETRQAIDRLRLVHTDDPKRVVLLSSVPIGIPVDEVAQWDTLRPNAVYSALGRFGGVLPLSSAWLAEHATDLFSTPKAAKRAVEKLKSPHPYNKVLLKAEGLFNLEHKRAKQRRWSRALVHPRETAPHDKLRSLLGDALQFREVQNTCETTSPKPEVRPPAPRVADDKLRRIWEIHEGLFDAMVLTDLVKHFPDDFATPADIHAELQAAEAINAFPYDKGPQRVYRAGMRDGRTKLFIASDLHAARMELESCYGPVGHIAGVEAAIAHGSEHPI